MLLVVGQLIKRREWYFSASKQEEMANLHIFLVREFENKTIWQENVRGWCNL